MTQESQDIQQMLFPDDRRYTREHVWAHRAGDVFTVGITDFAQNQLGDVIFVDLPAVGDVFDRDKEFGVAESSKSTSELYMPVAGVVEAVNAALNDEPTRINLSPYGEGWLIRVRPTDPSQFEALMSSRDYAAFLESEQ